METQLQFIKRERAAYRDGEFAVEDKIPRPQFRDRFDHVGKITGQGLARFRLEINVLAVAKCNAAETVPLRFVLPSVTGRDLLHRSRFHWWKWRLYDEGHSLG